MCLITEQKKPIKIRKEMVVYKDMYRSMDRENVVISIFMNISWDLERLYKVEISETDDSCVYDDTASIKYPCKTIIPRMKKGELISIGSGFHSAATKERYCEPANIVKCIIPKGSLIYKDRTGLIVSNQIIIKEIVK